MNLTVVSFWTGSPWREHAVQLTADCRTLGLPFEIGRLPDLGSWVANCAQKPAYIRDMLRELSAPVLWIDADARILQKPALLADPKEEFAVHAVPGRETRKQIGRDPIPLPDGWPREELGCRWFNSGTVYVRPTPKAFELLDLWCQLAATKSGDWDQWLLQEAWSVVRPETLWLPEPYCRWSRGRAADEPVIHQLIASAKIRNLDRGGVPAPQ